MKRTKLIALGASALMIAGALTACGSSEGSSAASSEPGSSSQSSTEPGSSPEESTPEESTPEESTPEESTPEESETEGSTTEGSTGSSEAGAVDYSADTQKDLTIPIATGWAEDVAVSNLYKYALEKRGYTVDMPELQVGPIFKGVANGDYDFFFDTWLPNTHADYWKEFGDQVNDINVWYDKAPLTIAVPDYMDIDSLADLKSIGDKVDKTIIGIDPGAGLTRVTKTEMMPAYGLTDAGWTLKTSSTAAMLAALKKAISNKEPIVVTLWRPHWAYAAFPIKDLKDPKTAMGEPDSIHVIGSKDFGEADPGVMSVLSNFHMDADTLNDLEYVVLQKNKDDMQAGAEKWAADNQDFMTNLFGPLE